MEKEQYKYKENPYGYKSKKIAAPKECLIGLAGPGLKISLNTVNITYKNKEIEANIWPEGLSKDVDVTILQQLENAWFFQKKPADVPTSQGFVVQVGNFDENGFGGPIDSNFLYTVKVANVERYMIFRMVHEDIKPVPDDTFEAVANWIGSVANVTVLEDKKKVKKEALRMICQAVSQEYTIPDYKGLHKKHLYLADARWGTLKKFQSYKMDPLKTTDPLGNTIAHLAIFNPFQDVFWHIAKTNPTLLNAQNIFGNTPLHNVALMHLRRHGHLNYFDWKLFWELPWNYSVKNNQGQTGIEKLLEIQYALMMVNAFQALINNDRAWSEVKKDNNISKLLSSMIIKYLKNTTTTFEEDTIKFVQVFIEHGADEIDEIFKTALLHNWPQLASSLLERVKVSLEIVTNAFSSKNRPITDVLLKQFDLNTLDRVQLNTLCKYAVQAGWADIVSLFAKKGCDLPLAWISNQQNTTKLTVANIIARVNCPVMPLKYLCVDNVLESKSKQELDNICSNLPEEIRALLQSENKDLWRWTLFLDDEAKRNRYLELYSAIHKVKRANDNGILQISSLGQIQFSVKCYYSRTYSERDWRELKRVGLQIWIGELSETPPDERYEILNYTKGDPRKSMKPHEVCKETNTDALHSILSSIGWPIEEDYIFLKILYFAFANVQGDLDLGIPKISAAHFFFPSAIVENLIPPTWYADFVRQYYGLESAIKESRRRKPRRTHEPNSPDRKSEDRFDELFD